MYLSNDTTLSGNDPQVTTVLRSGALAAGGSYAVSVVGTVPLATPGSYFLLFVTDPFDHVWELAGEGNNVVATPFTVSAAAADLEVALPIVTPDTIASGQPLPIEWTVVNNGTLPTTTSVWTDRIYLSADTAVDAGDYVLGARTHSGTLAAGASSVGSAAFPVPIAFSGLYYVLVAADADGHVLETNDGNNVRFRRLQISVTATPPANLVVLAPTAPGNHVSGQMLPVAWTSKNVGSGATNVSAWSDSVYLSTDATFDPGSDRFLGSYEHQGFLAPDEERAVSTSFLVPLGISGSWRVLIRTNVTGIVYEGGSTGDNLASTSPATTITLPPVSDLRITQVQVPATGTIGQPLTVTWTTTNDSGGTAQGTWTDSFFLSADGTLDASDLFLGEENSSAGTLPVGGVHVQSRAFDAPGVLPGSFFVLAFSDARGQIPESDENDNHAVSATAAVLGTVDVAADGVAVAQSLPLGASRYWRLVVPPGPPETLRVRLAHSNPSAWTELYASRDEIPHPGLADVSFTTTGASSQEIVLPDVAGGTYYVLARAPFGAGRGSPLGTLTVDVLPFELVSVEPARAGTGVVTLTLHGSQLHTLASVTLRRTGTSETIPAVEVHAASSTSALAAFDLSGATLGDYDVLVLSSALLSSERIGVLAVEPALPRAVGMTVEYPPSVKKGASGTATVRLTNEGNVNLSHGALVLARRHEPLVELRSDELALQEPESDGQRDSIVLFVADLGPAQSAVVHVECEVDAAYAGSEAVFALAGRAWSDVAWAGTLVPVSAEALRQAVLGDPASGSGLLQLAGSSAAWHAAVSGNLAADGTNVFPDGTLPETGRAWMAAVAEAATNGLPSIDLVPESALARASSDLACALFAGTSLDCAALEPTDCSGGLATVSTISVDGANVPVIVFCGATPTSLDPNEKHKPPGYGPQALISSEQPVPYRIYFENIESAEAPASLVQIRDVLEPTLRLSSFRPTRVAFGETQIDLPGNTSSYQNTFDLTEAHGVRLQMSIGVNAARNEAFWILQSLDPLTGLPITDGQRGFLPPNDVEGSGQGYVDFLISTSTVVGTGSAVRNISRITFDQNPPLTTNEVQNIVDADRPTSALSASPVDGQDFQMDLSWGGADGPQGSGLASYSVYASRDNGPYTAIATDSTATGSRLNAVPGSTYRLYTRARDNTGNTEAAPTNPDAVFVAPADCNGNGRSDTRDVSEQTSADCDANLVPDECQPNGDGDALIDACDPCPLDASNDLDGDGLCGANDNCATVANPSQANADGDAFGDACDACVLDPLNDVDGDGVCGDVDNCPAAANASQANADGDARGDACDPCPLDPLDDVDADGFCGQADNCPTVPNTTQANADGDARGDACDPCPFDALDDVDADGLCADADNCPAVANPGQANADGDALGDACDLCALDPLNDLDGDGVCGDVDNCPTVANANQANADGDALGDACDACPLDPANDVDADGVCGDVDNCPAVANASQANADGDARGDACDPCPLDVLDDADGDGLCADVDNCPTLPNAGQANADGDALGDACDACALDPLNDLDADGVCGDVDNCPSVANAAQANGDGDGLGDACDACPIDPANDVDADGVCGDLDNCPTVANASQANLDGDARGDACDLCPLDALDDVDGDGVCGDVDNCPTLANPAQLDCNGNQIGDACEGAPDCNANGVPDSCDVASGASQDFDGNGTPDECQNLMPFCFGDGPSNGGPACPCGNHVPVGAQRGCANSTGTGAMLVGAGTTSLTADTLVLTVSGMTNVTNALLVQGELAAGGGHGVAPFHDGLLCLDGTLQRLGTRVSSAGTAAFGSPGTPISVLGDVALPGPRTYQVVYRNVFGPCLSGANASNGLRVLWAP